MLAVIDPKLPFQTEFQPVINDLQLCLRGALGDNLHSIYLFGSVARKTARVGLSNIDVVVVTQRDLAGERATLTNSVKWRVQRHFTQVVGMTLQCTTVNEVASLTSLFSWGFLLKHCAVCIYGDDLAECFGEYELSWEIAKHWNDDVADWLAVYRDKIALANMPAIQSASQFAIARKLLRASYALVMHKEQRWLEDPIACGEAFLRYYPNKAQEIERLTILLSGRVIAKRSVIGLLDSYGQWLSDEYRKTEFRIG
ncbi:nucleotidyltransferase domain-containing protein [Vibrio sp. SM6]|uniref:Nucleotidyltransferase domain-containing protein n=1 Tax=Vibrio agarilyticus TaxID=2726741 RepID=A0A7X8YGT2_9VIBR|nr:nucleotidyltransferase domain-containing protein [Vibrio agarilyticus]NLS12984.1 nucleotidyltransferase domain-containing protein [Vibrio agarilyticus]